MNTNKAIKTNPGARQRVVKWQGFSPPWMGPESNNNNNIKVVPCGK